MKLKKLYPNSNLKKSAGYDGLNSVLIKQIKKNISVPLSILLNKSLISGEFPDLMKLAKVIPVYKKSNKNDLANYRPISLLPIFSKIFEKAVHKRLYHFLISNNLSLIHI